MNTVVKSKNKQQKHMKQIDEFICLPEKQTVTHKTVVIGYIFRSMVAYTAVLGLIIFIYDAFMIKIPLWYVMIACFVPVMLFSVMLISGWCCFAGFGIIAVIASVFTFYVRNPFAFALESMKTFWNLIMFRLSNAGYRSMPLLELKKPEAFDQTALAFFSAAIIAVLLALIFVISTVRKTRMLPMMIVGLLICSSIFTYNISSTNWGFALILSALCGITVLKMYDMSYRGKGIKGSSLGGYAGFITVTGAILILLIPTINVQKSWVNIDFISDKLQFARTVISSLVIGTVPNMYDIGYPGNMDTLNSRNTTAEQRVFTGKEMLEVHSTYNIPIYLRSWIGSYYSGDSWYSASSSEVGTYKANVPDDFTPEFITHNFYKVISPSLVHFTDYDSYADHSDEGYITVAVDVKNLHSAGNLLYIPSVINPQIGLLEYGSDDDIKYSNSWKAYYEGIITTEWYNFNKQYRAITYLPYYRNPDFIKTLGNNLKYYNLVMNIIATYANVTDKEQQRQIIDFTEKFLDGEGVKYEKPTALERYFELSYGEQLDYIYDNYTLPEWYDKYVNGVYLSTTDSYSLMPISTSILKSLNGVVPRENINLTVMAVIEWLSENCVYTLNPAQPDISDSKSSLDIFLDDTREGYCVQFATAAVMLLRTLGIPARYVEGYMADEFVRDERKDNEKISAYVAKVHDYNAHAWLEVYVNGIGWMQYEATPTYYNESYRPFETTEVTESVTSDTPQEEIEPEVTEENIPKPVYEEKTDEDISSYHIVSLLMILAFLAVITVFILYWLTRSVQAFQKRYYILDHAEKSFLESDEIHKTANEVYKYIMQIFEVAGFKHEMGELPSQFASRISNHGKMNFSRNFEEILLYIQKEEFGPGMNREELRLTAVYMRELWSFVYKNMNMFQKFRNRYVKRVI